MHGPAALNLQFWQCTFLVDAVVVAVVVAVETAVFVAVAVAVEGTVTVPVVVTEAVAVLVGIVVGGAGTQLWSSFTVHRGRGHSNPAAST